jgi:putative membrane protein insertion efficiency factor
MISGLLQKLIRLYQLLLSPFWGSQCRFFPTCSNYGIEAIKKYGSVRGSYLTVRRICRCNPWTDGGFDPVP